MEWETKKDDLRVLEKKTLGLEEVFILLINIFHNI